MQISARSAEMPRPIKISRSVETSKPCQNRTVSRSQSTFICFFCEAKGHKKSECSHMRRLLNAGEIHLDWKNRICLGPAENGYRPIWKPQGMLMMDAVFRAANAEHASVRQEQVKDAQTASTEVLKLLKDAQTNILRFLKHSERLNQCETPLLSL